MPRKNYLLVAIGALALLFVSSEALAENIDWLNAHERGTIRALDHFVAKGGYVPLLKQVDRAWRTTAHHRRMNAGHDHSSVVERHMCTLSVKVLNYQRTNASRPSAYRVDVPPSVRGYVDAYRALVKVARKYPRVRHCNELTWNQKVEFVNAVRAVQTERSRLSSVAGTRRSSGGWNASVSVDLAPLPVKIEFVKGVVKLRLKAGRFDAQLWRERNTPSTYSGLEYLVVRADGVIRYFDIRGQRFTMDIPGGSITVNGPALTFTCGEDCANELRIHSDKLAL
ncbi:MAG: hypothetical protein AAGA65_26485 [Actinomycetota bacterium]